MPELLTMHVKSGEQMDFCTMHFWLWVGACLKRRGLHYNGSMICANARAGDFSKPLPPVEALPA